MYFVVYDKYGVQVTSFKSGSLEECRAFVSNHRNSISRSVREVAASYRILDRAGESYEISPRKTG